MDLFRCLVDKTKVMRVPLLNRLITAASVSLFPHYLPAALGSPLHFPTPRHQLIRLLGFLDPRVHSL